MGSKFHRILLKIFDLNPIISYISPHSKIIWKIVKIAEYPKINNSFIVSFRFPGISVSKNIFFWLKMIDWNGILLNSSYNFWTDFFRLILKSFGEGIEGYGDFDPNWISISTDLRKENRNAKVSIKIKTLLLFIYSGQFYWNPLRNWLMTMIIWTQNRI